MSISESVPSDPSLKETYQASSLEILNDFCFIETQFPVSKMSKESYAERKAVTGQTMTGLGKWWGRKPLVLCRAAILGLLLPATGNPKKDREIFLRVMTMDDDGMLRRKSVNIGATELFRHLPPADRQRYFETGSNEKKANLKRSLVPEEREDLQKRVFLSLSYDKRLDYCDRPEQIDGPSSASWNVINAHLGTNVSTLQELIVDLGKRRFGHVPRVGDSFCGGGSIPFEAARLGCEAYGSDLNPVAALLTWAAVNIIGGGPKVADEIQKAQREVWDAVDRQTVEWGIEHREPDSKTGRRWRADAYVYCTEIGCPECGWRVPGSPSWVIAEKSGVVVRLVPNSHEKNFGFEIIENASTKEMSAAADSGTVQGTELVCPHCKARTPIRVIRGDGRGTFGENKSLLREWENQDVVSRRSDIFRERLYCIRWLDSWVDKRGEVRSERHYVAPTVQDLKREQKVIQLLQERFETWQKKGIIPNRKIEPGTKTDEPIRTRGWTHWHHFFTPRQLLILGLLNESTANHKLSRETEVLCELGLGRCCDWNSRLCRWVSGLTTSGGIGFPAQTFYNQALNPLYNYGARPAATLGTAFIRPIPSEHVSGESRVEVSDCRAVDYKADIWITDPPYADAICYDELSEFFLVWYEAVIRRRFPKWYADSKRALAVRGTAEEFSQAMVACYRQLSSLTPDNGLQVVMFTHQNAGVWADLALILWAAGLRVTAAWCIATETGSELKEGNYVQGTVLLVLRKQTSEETAFLDEVYQEVESEVRRQLDSMRDLDDVQEPNFGDTDYQLAAYAAALRVLTARKIEEIDVAYELTKTRKKGEKSPVEELIERAVKIACDHLVPRGIDSHLWKSLSGLERFYLKGLELESHGERRVGVYQELARGFGIDEYKPLLASTKANQVRLKTGTEFGGKEMGDSGFGATLVRHALFSALKTKEAESTRDGITWLTTEVEDYAANRQGLIEILEFLATLRQNASMPHWHKDSEAAGLLAGALRNRQDNV